MTDIDRQLNAAYQKKVVEKLEKTVRAVALFVDAELVTTTPVDTGRARSNWLPTLNTPAAGQVEPGGKPDMGRAIAAYTLADTILITNNLPYIRRLNEGYSKQAPAGFVDIALAKAKRIVRK